MNQRTFNLAVGLIFALVALGHAARIAAGWPFVVGTWNVPTWASAVAVLATAYLALAALRLNRSAAG